MARLKIDAILFLSLTEQREIPSRSSEIDKAAGMQTFIAFASFMKHQQCIFRVTYKVNESALAASSIFKWV